MVYSGDRKRQVSEHIRRTANTDIEPYKQVDDREKRKKRVMDHIKKSGGKQ